MASLADFQDASSSTHTQPRDRGRSIEDVDGFLCPISQDLMVDPVVAADGHTYDREAISKWFKACSSEGRPIRSPMSGQKMESSTLIPNIALRKAIEDLIQCSPHLRSMSAGNTAKNGQPKAQDSSSDVSPRLEAAAASSVAQSGEYSSPTKGASVQKDYLSKSNRTANGSNMLQRKGLLPVDLITSASDHASQGHTGVMYQWMRDRRFHAHGWQHTHVDNLKSSHKAYVTSLAYVASSLESFTVATGARDNCVKLWRPSRIVGGQWELLQTLQGHTDDINCLCSLSTSSIGSSRPGIFVSGSRDKSLRVWTHSSTSDGEWECSAVLAGRDNCSYEKGGHKDFVHSCDLYHDGGGIILASGGADMEIHLWDLSSGSNVPFTTLKGHSYGVTTVSFADSPHILAGTPCAGQSIIASGSLDETVRVWDCRAKYGGRIASLRCGSPVLDCCWGGGTVSGNWLAAGGGIPPGDMRGSTEDVDGWIRVWDVRTWKAAVDCNIYQHESSDTYYSNEEHKSEVQTRLSFKLASDTPGRAEGDAKPERVAHAGFVSSLCTLADAHNRCDTLVSAGDDKVVRLWRLDLNKGENKVTKSTRTALTGSAQLLSSLKEHARTPACALAIPSTIAMTHASSIGNTEHE